MIGVTHRESIEPFEQGQVQHRAYLKGNDSVLYLAEVRKQKSGFISKATTELRLLACQRNDQTWTNVPGEEVIPAEEATNFDPGVLVLVNLNNNRQLQGPPESASAQIVRDLQRFSRLQEKIKSQEEEIEAWKQSLTTQAQELAKREMELSADLEHLEQLREQGGGAALGDADLDQARQEVAHLKSEFERKTRELESAWEQLRGAQAKLEEQRDSGPAAAPAAALDPEQVARLRELIDYLQTTIPPTAALREQLTQALEILDNQRENCAYHWQQLEEKRADAQQQQSEANEQGAAVEEQRQHLQAISLALQEARQTSQSQHHQLELKQHTLALLQTQQQQQVQLMAILAPFTAPRAEPSDGSGVDLNQLEQMPLEELQGLVDNLQRDLDKVVQFVEQQEEELRLQRQTVEELEDKLKNANVYEASEIEQELEEEREQKGMLDETLVGQRRTLGDRQRVLQQHLRVLRRRQGITEPEIPGAIDVTPALEVLQAQDQETTTALEQLQQECDALQQELADSEAVLQQQASDRDATQVALQELEVNWQEARAAAALLWGRVNLYEEMLKPLQDSVEEMQQKLVALSELLDQTDQTTAYQQEALGNLQETAESLAPA